MSRGTVLLVGDPATLVVGVPGPMGPVGEVGAGGHASTHEDGGSDEVSLAQSQIIGLVAALAAKAADTHDHPATDINDSTPTGRAVITAVDAAAARTAIGAGTGSSNFDGTYPSLTVKPTLGDSSGLDVGTAAGTVAAGNDGRIVGAAQKSQNLADLADAGAARANLGVPTTSHASTHEDGGSDEIEVADLATAETNTALVLHPDGAGGMAWGADQGGAGSTTLDALTDTDLTGKQDGDALVYVNGTGKWEPGSPGAGALDDLTDVATAGEADGDILMRQTGTYEPYTPGDAIGKDVGTGSTDVIGGSDARIVNGQRVILWNISTGWPTSQGAAPASCRNTLWWSLNATDATPPTEDVDGDEWARAPGSAWPLP